MKNILVAAACLFVCTLQAQPIPIGKKAALTYKALQQHHFSPRKLDDTLSNYVFQQFIRSINPDGLFFSVEDTRSLLKHQYKIDDYITGENLPLLQDATSFMLAQLESYLQFLKAEENTSIVFPEKTYWEIGEATIPENKQSLQTYRSHFILVELLMRMMRSGKDFSQITSMAPALKKSVIEKEIENVNRLKGALTSFLENCFLNALCVTHDPHSAYFSASDLQHFIHSLSSNSLSFGLVLEQDWLGRIIIQNIIPGSNAQKSDSLFIGDQILKVIFKNGVTVDLANGDDLEDLKNLIDDPTLDEAVFTVISVDQKKRQVNLTKTSINIQENSVSAFLLKGPVTIGYLSLPSFYTQWENDVFTSSANDVAKAIIKLKQENIQGLILDLRYNGGGSMEEAINLLSIFIDQGGLFQVKSKTGVSTTKDPTRGVIYDGSLVVMINKGSASASELVASTLQDHKRAILTGSSSFGKATSQQVINLIEGNVNSNEISSENGALKITTEKMYRVTGASYQLKGVHPDVYLPDISTYLYPAEKDLPFVLNSDSIARKAFYTPFFKKKEWNNVAQKNIRQKEFTLKLEQLQQMLSKGFIINPEYFASLQRMINDLSAQFSSESLYQVNGLQYDKSLTTFDAYNTSLQQEIKSLQRSPYVYEVYKLFQNNLSSY